MSLTPLERKALREKIQRVQAKEDAEARRFLLISLKAGVNNRESLLKLAREFDIYWRNVLRAKRQLGVQFKPNPRSK